MNKKDSIFVIITTIMISVSFIIGRNIGWSEAYRELTDSSACKMSRRKYHNQLK